MIVVTYRTRPDAAAENQRLIEAVFGELAERGLDGVRYAALGLEDGTFVHIAEIATEDGTNPLAELPAFTAFTAELEARCVESPRPRQAEIVGDHGLLRSPPGP